MIDPASDHTSRTSRGRESETSIRNVLKGAVFFGLLGPPIGALVFALWGAVGIAASGNFWELVIVLPAYVAIALFSYMFAGIPALLTGAVAGAFRSSLVSTPYYLAVGFLAGLLSVAFGAIFLRDVSDGYRFQSLLLMYGLPGVISGSFTAALFGARRMKEAAAGMHEA